MLFDGVSFGMEQGERLGLIGANGIGKTTLLNIIAGREMPDNGNVVFNNEVRFEFLTQIPQFESEELVLDAVMSAKPQLFSQLEQHKQLCHKLNERFDPVVSKQLERLTDSIEAVDGWTLENDAKAIISRLGLQDIHKEVRYLSGGLRKRVALARALLSEPELLILDEPTNHLDADSVQWLQDRLMNSSGSLLFVTHDRYFLDAVATRIIELDRKRIFSYPGNYEKYLELKESFVSTEQSTVTHMLSRLRSELAWLQKGARARRSKQRGRIDWVEKLKKDAVTVKEKKIKIELGKSFMGSRIIDAVAISKDIDGKRLFHDFTYIAKPKDRIGIIGPNGCGKSTLLNILSARLQPDTGTVKHGASVKIGFFTQENIELKDSQSLVGTLREVAEYIDVGIGRDRYLTAKDLLNKFLFPQNRHNSLVGTLSGGEKRRLALLAILMDNPNVLLLDEPTNDFDIPTLSALEEYLDDFYGTLLIVSHDRAFLDRTINMIWAFDGKGGIKEYPGNYSNYLEKIETEKAGNYSEKPQKQQPKRENVNLSGKRKLSYMEQRELKQLEHTIELLEKEKAELEQFLYSGTDADYREMNAKSERLAALSVELDEKMFRWLELSQE